MRVGRRGRGKRGGKFGAFVGDCKVEVWGLDKLWMLDLCIKIGECIIFDVREAERELMGCGSTG
jgi:hypothetical protein